MRLTELCQTYRGQPDPDILGLAQDSRRVEKGWLFAALPGAKTDGRKFVEDAVTQGAVAVLSAQKAELPAGVAQIVDPNPRRAISLMAARFYGRQPRSIAAVTGTNGKTSTVNFTQQIWQALGRKAASLGTLGVRAPGMERYGSLTTPDPVSLHADLADLAAAGIDHLAMEASSHGLHQYRLDGVRVSVAGFTNLTRDHLDYHPDMDDYYEAKARLFSDVLTGGGAAVINADVPEFGKLKSLCEKRKIRVIDYGAKAKSIWLMARKPIAGGQEIEIELFGRREKLVLPLVGSFMAMNALCALGLVLAGDMNSADKALAALSSLKGAPGRLQLVPGHPRGAAVYVDYAHTPDALQNVLEALRPHTEGKLYCLAGCGGDRDPGKRPVMGRIAAELADIAVITDDNPRTEDPAKIRAAMMAGAKGAKEIGGRREAIAWAINELREGDVLVLAGKGHEQGQIIGDRVEPFDDVEEAKKAIAGVKR